MSGGSRREDYDQFKEQLRLQKLFEEGPRMPEGSDPFTYVDQADGTTYEWDLEKKAWFPKISEDFLATYQANYGFSDDSPSSSHTKKETKADVSEKAKGKPTEQKSIEDIEKKQKGEKRKPEPGWFQVEEDRNTNVYVTGLPPDITKEEFVQLMSKCGIIMKDPQTEEYKIKLYKDKQGNLKGDGLCCYLKKESVPLALKLLDDDQIRGYRLHVEKAKFQLKGEYDASKKKKKCKDYKKKLSLQQKQLDWWPEKKTGTARMRHERVVIIKNMFHPKDFEEDPLVLNEIREDLRTECEKFGQVKKVLVFDRHPDGVASVSYKEPEEADLCIQALNERWFGGRQLNVQVWDGVTDYQVEETSREREERLKGWESFLEHPNIQKEIHSSDPESPSGSGILASGKTAPEKSTPKEQKQKVQKRVTFDDDGTQSTDSSLGGSDNEDMEHM
ncbi:HIV Tat-specific factor 1 [Sarcophilus harrisii]|uniref:17S U2 SnRNP complex component HTATSF1 n=1 Tax=Sarcophilus harrisii TaxID=9305 RepID=G3VW54_SARHA|nr:HIV Tat-specific factor 1 [Sarcophilus harrisii]XP_031800329.1 HIV Tat-specific factor 1 [Sarcophilus harrisii]